MPTALLQVAHKPVFDGNTCLTATTERHYNVVTEHKASMMNDDDE